MEIKHNAFALLYDFNRYKAIVTLKEKNGFCQQKAILLGKPHIEHVEYHEPYADFP